LLVAVYIYMFGPHSYRIHMAVTGLTMLSISLVFTLIIALDYPFRGDLSVDNDAYLGVKEVSDRAFESAEAEHPGERGGEHAAERKEKK
jgi:hypothetical protein